MNISAKSDYAIRAALEIAAHEPAVVTAETIAAGQGLSRKFIVSILADLGRAGLVRVHRGSSGGYSLTRPAREVTLGSIIRAVDGPLAEVHGQRPDEIAYPGAAEHLADVWIAVRASLRVVLDGTTLRHALTGELPDAAQRLLAQPGARAPHPSPYGAGRRQTVPQRAASTEETVAPA